MPLVVNTNVLALNAQRHLGNNTNALQKSMEKLSSGFRINRAADDAAGLALSENLRTQIRGAKKAMDNIQDGIGVLNIADGALQQITDNLQRMRELAIQAANDTYDSNQRTAMQAEYDQLSDEITRIAQATEFNGVKLLQHDPIAPAAFMLQIGPNGSADEDQLDIAATGAFASAAANSLNVAGESLMASADIIQFTLPGIDDAITAINTQRSAIGALTNRLEGAYNNLSIAVENLSASESRIRNVDVAAESANLVKNQILQQAAAAMLAQANQSPSIALSLLG